MNISHLTMKFNSKTTKEKKSIPKTALSRSISSEQGTIPVPPLANTSLQISNSFWTGNIFFWRRRLLLDLEFGLVFVSVGNSRNSLPLRSARIVSIPIQPQNSHKIARYTSPTHPPHKKCKIAIWVLTQTRIEELGIAQNTKKLSGYRPKF